MTVLLKLGGSVITEKDEPETIDGRALDRAAEALVELDEPLVLVHGGGSFGHHHADRHGLSAADGSRDPRAIAAVHFAMCRLNEAVVEHLSQAGVGAVPVHPISLAVRSRNGTLTVSTAPIEMLVDEGFVPVLHGDLVGHAGLGVTVLSGDELVAELAGSIPIDRIGLCSGVPGVLDEDGAVIPTIHTLEPVIDLVGPSEVTDVTGGMAGKLRTLLQLDQPSWIFDLDALPRFVRGEAPGTTVSPTGVDTA